jgi:hypothetical protein
VIPPAREERRRPERRRATDRQIAADRSLPIWARMVGIVGPLGTIAFFLVYVGAQTLPALQTQLASARQAVESEVVALRLETQRLGQLITLNQSRTEENHRLLVRICAAVTEGKDRAACFDP